MGFENLKHDFPETPEEIRAMIRKEVTRQIKTEQPKFRRRRSVGKTFAASLAAVMLCGLTVFAGVSLYRLQLQKTGEHGVSIGIEAGENTAENPDAVPVAIPNVRLETGYLPEGMVQVGQGKYSFEDSLHQGGVSMTFYRMDTGDDQFKLQHEDVLSSEEFTAGGNQGIYLEYPRLSQDEISFSQRIYVAYTDLHYVMEMYAASDVNKEEAIKIAEHVQLVPTEDTEDENFVAAQNWSDYLKSLEPSQEGEGCEVITSIAKEQMENLHKTGDSFPLDDQGLTARVADVKISDDLRLLDASFVDEDLRKETDENGQLLPAQIQYMKTGDTNSLSQEIKSREVPQKLVYATIEYQNTSSEEMTDVLFFGELARIQETSGQMQILENETPSESDTWDMAIHHGLSASREMVFYDVRGRERGNNYIESIKPGETVTVHMAWIVTEEELGTLFLTLDPSGGAYEFTDSSLAIGYVDIRQ